MDPGAEQPPRGGSGNIIAAVHVAQHSSCMMADRSSVSLIDLLVRCCVLQAAVQLMYLRMHAASQCTRR